MIHHRPRIGRASVWRYQSASEPSRRWKAQTLGQWWNQVFLFLVEVFFILFTRFCHNLKRSFCCAERGCRGAQRIRILRAFSLLKEGPFLCTFDVLTFCVTFRFILHFSVKCRDSQSQIRSTRGLAKFAEVFKSGSCFMGFRRCFRGFLSFF